MGPNEHVVFSYLNGAHHVNVTIHFAFHADARSWSCCVVRNTFRSPFLLDNWFAMMISASCRRLLHRNGVYYSRHRLQRAATVAKLLQILTEWPAKRLFCASAPLNKLNQPKLREENELSSDLTHPQPCPPGVLPPAADHAHSKENCELRSHDHTAASTNTVDGAVREQHLYYEGQAWIEDRSKEAGGREEHRQEEVEWAHTELTWKKLPSIYLKLSKSRLTGMSTCSCFL